LLVEVAKEWIAPTVQWPNIEDDGAFARDDFFPVELISGFVNAAWRNQWFHSGSDHSFPSGEVATLSAIVTPFVLEYGHEHPTVYALELLPIYDAIARVKIRGHWQTDVLAGFAVDSLAGYYAHSRDNPFILTALPQGFMVGWHRRW
jgi:membrane-associated phospholipid phosphatase